MLTILLDRAELRRTVPSTGDREKSRTSVYPHIAQLTSRYLLGLPPTALGVRVQVQVRLPSCSLCAEVPVAISHPEKHFYQRLVDTISITRALGTNSAGPQQPP